VEHSAKSSDGEAGISCTAWKIAALSDCAECSAETAIAAPASVSERAAGGFWRRCLQTKSPRPPAAAPNSHHPRRSPAQATPRFPPKFQPFHRRNRATATRRRRRRDLDQASVTHIHRTDLARACSLPWTNLPLSLASLVVPCISPAGATRGCSRVLPSRIQWHRLSSSRGRFRLEEEPAALRSNARRVSRASNPTIKCDLRHLQELAVGVGCSDGRECSQDSSADFQNGYSLRCSDVNSL
jgi:hypothetical protein